MAKKILILTEPADLHAQAVAEILRRKGAEALLWHTSDFPSRSTESVSFEDGKMGIRLRGPGLEELEEITPEVVSVWHRRPAYVLDQSLLHPADRDFADLQCRLFRRALFGLLAREAFWVNPHDNARKAGRKPLQHATALDAGLAAPATLYSNDPEHIRDFIDRHGGRVVFKPLRGTIWRDESTFWMPYTSLVTKDDLVEDDLVRSAPGIFQEIVPKAFELRVTVMGNWVFGAKVLSQQTETGKLDWRKSYHELAMEPFEVPRSVADRCIEVLERLGLAFGCFDLVVTPRGEHVFLEVNEMGQFLFVEHYTGLPLLDAFSEFLLQGRRDFNWEENASRVRYSDVQEVAEQETTRATELHRTLGDTASWEGQGLPPQDSARPRAL